MVIFLKVRNIDFYVGLGCFENNKTLGACVFENAPTLGQYLICKDLVKYFLPQANGCACGTFGSTHLFDGWVWVRHTHMFEGRIHLWTTSFALAFAMKCWWCQKWETRNQN